MEPFPFVLGCGRSGTTLVRTMLAAHSRIAVPPESYFVVTMAGRRRQYEGLFAAGDYGPFMSDLMNTPFTWWEIPEEGVLVALEDARPRRFSDAVRVLYHMYSLKQGKDLYADKTPKYVLDLPILAELFPEARFVHVIRDGRDVVSSYMDKPFGPQTVPMGALFWKRRVTRGRAAGEVLGSERYMELRYEELVEDPEPVLSRLCHFIGVDYESAMLRFHESAMATLGATPEAANHPRLVLPLSQGLRDWRQELTAHEVDVFEALAGGALERFGYRRHRPRAGTRAQLEAAAVRGRAVLEQAWDRLMQPRRREGDVVRSP